MKNFSNDRNIKVCSGPGCKAWASEKIARELEGLEMEGVKICRVACMKKCGGGATVQMSPSSEMRKMRSFEEALDTLVPGSLSPVFC
jgi:hypothetical protein